MNHRRGASNHRVLPQSENVLYRVYTGVYMYQRYMYQIDGIFHLPDSTVQKKIGVLLLCIWHIYRYLLKTID